MKALWLLLLLLGAGSLAAQKKDSVYLKVYAEADADSVRSARYFELAHQSLRIEIAKLHFSDKGEPLSEKRFMAFSPYNDGKGCGCWQAKVAKGEVYRLRHNHPGFEPEERTIDPAYSNTAKFFLKMRGDSLPETYGVNLETSEYESYKYIAGTLNFSETIVVYFKSGDGAPLPSENQAFLKEKALKDLQKAHPDISVRHVAQLSYAKNAFYVVLGLPDRRTMAELLYAQENGDKLFPRGFHIGNDITRVIETLLAVENVEMVVPTFYNDKEMEYRTVDPNDYPKSKRLQRKLGDIYYEYEQMLDELEKKINK